MLKITNVFKDSIAEDLQIMPGDEIISFNNEEILSVQDLNFYEHKKKFSFELSNGRIFKIKKNTATPIGVEASFIAPSKHVKK